MENIERYNLESWNTYIEYDNVTTYNQGDLVTTFDNQVLYKSLVNSNLGNTPPNFYGAAYCTLYPDLKTLIFGGKLPWGKNGEINVACSDSVNTVVFSLKVIKNRK